MSNIRIAVAPALDPAEFRGIVSNEGEDSAIDLSICISTSDAFGTMRFTQLAGAVPTVDRLVFSEPFRPGATAEFGFGLNMPDFNDYAIHPTNGVRLHFGLLVRGAMTEAGDVRFSEDDLVRSRPTKNVAIQPLGEASAATFDDRASRRH